MKEQLQIFGIRAVMEAVHSGKSIDKVFIQKGLRGQLIHELEKLLRDEGISCSYVPVEKLDRLSKKNHQGVVARISPVTFQSLDDVITKALDGEKTPLFIILDQVSDVRNFGAMVRTAECTGVQGIIVPKSGGASISGDTIKTSAGAIFKVPICKVDHIKDAIYYLQSSGIKIVAATEKTDKLIYDVDFTKPTALIMGSEEKGIASSVLKLVDECVKLPLMGEIESLNVSVACGAVLYEIVRQRL
ncbi:MAG: 23S rRNA (guanosine(2251)-2'-O)-methyltransferase RlmB [Flavobacteriaceae bacterium]|nr:23S rRNA (guanosine(2251)-2'-O)-methyltransferase RlmB [Flavobacteriaceae bacterium]